MPIFEFVCQECSHPFEELVRSSNSVEEVVCPTCGSHEVRKQISTFAARITGSSFSPSFSSGKSCGPAAST
ncbi:MAG: zinc ribbon domain-containing protein [Chloroflexi bacterium]|nr:zinc ribbon domain-containing protein [Chloroflexota bacterium]